MKYRKTSARKKKCSRGGKRSGEVRRDKMLLREPVLRPRDPGEFLGVFELRLKDERVRRWILRQGPRRNNVEVTLGPKSVVCGWDTLLNGIRPHLAVITRQVAT